MSLEWASENLPLYIKGALGVEDSLKMSRMIAQSDELMAEMKLALALNDLMQNELTEPPPFPQAVYQEAAKPSLIPTPLTEGFRAIRDAADITRATFNMIRKFL